MLIKYIKSVLWRVAKRLSYVEDARCLKVNLAEDDGLSYEYISSTQRSYILGLKPAAESPLELSSKYGALNSKEDARGIWYEGVDRLYLP